MTAQEVRDKKGFSRYAKERVRRRAGYRCEACGKPDDGHTHSQLQVHHDPPIALGGDKNSDAWALDGTCHKVADKLAFDEGISLGEVEEELGRYPLRQYRWSLQKGKVDKVVERVAGRLRTG